MEHKFNFDLGGFSFTLQVINIFFTKQTSQKKAKFQMSLKTK